MGSCSTSEDAKWARSARVWRKGVEIERVCGERGVEIERVCGERGAFVRGFFIYRSCI